MLEASGSSPLVPCDRVMEFNDIDDKGIRESIFKDIKGCFFVKGVPCFFCKALELCNVVIEVLLLHLEFPELLLGSGFNGSIGVRIGESIEDRVPQVLFGGEYSCHEPRYWFTMDRYKDTLLQGKQAQDASLWFPYRFRARRTAGNLHGHSLVQVPECGNEFKQAWENCTRTG